MAEQSHSKAPITEAETVICLPASDAAVARAAAALRAGQLVAFPTETVYGLGADACNPQALARLFEAKRRPSTKPLPVLVSDIEAARRLIVFDARIEALCRHFWPGALTIVGRRRADCPVAPLASAGGETLAVRHPDHGVIRRLLAAFGGPVAAPSANISGAPSPTTADELDMEILAATAIVIDGGSCPLGTASTVVQVEEAGLAILRIGAIAPERIAAVAGPLMPAQDAGP